MPEPLIAVTGATGSVGGRVAARLAAAGAAQRLVVRDAARAPRLDGAEVREVPGYHAGEAMRAALAGAHTLFLVPAEEDADRVAQHVAVVEAAEAAGVQRLVYLSFLGAAAGRHLPARARPLGDGGADPRHGPALDVPPHEPLPRLRAAHGRAGRRDRGPGRRRDCEPHRLDISRPRRRAHAEQGRASVVARADVADVASAVLLAGDRHDGETLDVTGGEALTLAEMAAVLTPGGRAPRRLPRGDAEEARASRAHYGAPDWLVEAWISTYTAIAAGELATVTDTVARLAGHEPQTLAEYVRAHPDCLDHVQSA